MKRLTTDDSGCDLVKQVIAWQPLPEPYKKTEHEKSITDLI